MPVPALTQLPQRLLVCDTYSHAIITSAQHLISALAMSRFNADTASWSLGKELCTIGIYTHHLLHIALSSGL